MHLLKNGSNATLRLKWPFGQTLGLAVILIVAGALAIEVFGRTDFSRSHLPVPSLGSRHRQLELQVARLDLFVERYGRVDCVFLGSSLVWLGFDPDVFAEAYSRQTGQDIRCFNFGIETLPASGAGALVEILVEDYHPDLLIYGVAARDYAITKDAEDNQVITNTPWVRYRNGEPTVGGWLYTNSYFYRYLQLARNLLHFDVDVLRRTVGTNRYDLLGFLPKTDVAKEENIKAAERTAALWLRDYKVQPENLLGLERILDQRKHDVEVIVVEMPVNQSYFEYFGRGEQDYALFLSEIRDRLANWGLPLLETTELNLIPDDGWWDKSHMNKKGADIFSAWLGRRLGQAVRAGSLNIPDSSGKTG